MNFVDVDPDTGVARDFMCEKRSYEGHKGTDIAIRSMYELEKGVDVHAVASGKVLRLRDGEEDSFKTSQEMEAVREAGKECGNGIIIDHGEGWLTQYCHLKKGSLKVKEGDDVYAGQDIAQVGLSGITEHPHIHLSVLFEGKHIDPFTGAEINRGCQLGNPKSLWRTSEIKYEPFSLYDAGFIAQKPDFEQISKGNKEPYPNTESDVLIFWGAYLGAKEGDKISMSITDPQGNILVNQDMVQKHVKARQYYFVGKKRPESGWLKGTYRAKIVVSREGLADQEIQKAHDLY